MHEIEVKVRVENPEPVMKALEALGCAWSDAITQHDTVYVKDASSIQQYLRNNDFLRLRVQNGDTTILTLKHHPERADNPDSAPLEHELTVDSKEEMEKLLLTLGFIEAVQIKKARKKAKHEKWEICVDEVEGLGTFIEIEELATPDTSVPETRKRMRAFLTQIGIPENELFTNRYDTLLLEKKFGL